jgi:PAS domain S-box-containing protein
MTEKETEMRRILAALEESENRLNAIIQKAVDGIITIDKKGLIQSVNPAALDLFGYLEDTELIGSNVSMLMPEPDRSRHDGYMDNYHSSGQGRIIGIGRRVEGLRRDGTLFPFHLSISELELDSGTIYTGIIHDVTHQVKAEEELKALNASLEQKVKERTEQLDLAIDELKRSNNHLSAEVRKRKQTEREITALLEKEIELGALKSRFVSMASHEFRTPLSGILSSASLIEKYVTETDHDKRQKHVNRIKISVQTLTNILNDFLSLDKLQSGKVSIHLSEFFIQELVHEVQEEFYPSLEEKRHMFYEHSGAKDPLSLDRNVVKNILLNLCSNAMKYSPKDEDIHIRTEQNQDRLTIEVEDHGIGIPEADQKHLFERFFRAQNAVNIKGTGLGLNIVKRYLELMDGSISFVSREGEGTTFVVDIPTRLT